MCSIYIKMAKMASKVVFHGKGKEQRNFRQIETLGI
jgi:hypothetical protein